MTLVVALLTIAVAVLALLVVGLLRSHATILRRLHELGAGVGADVGGGGVHGDARDAGAADAARLDEAEVASRVAPGVVSPSLAPAGRPAADVGGTGPDGAALGLRVVGAGHDTVLAFLSTGCSTCAGFWEQLAEAELPERTRLVIVTKGPEEESPTEVARLAPAGVLVVMSGAAWADYEVPGSPYVVHVEGSSGTVRGEGTGADWPQVRRMLLQAAGDRGTRGRTKAAADTRRERDIDRTLLAAGIAPGDPSLYRNAEQIAPLTEEPGAADDDGVRGR
jgi:hypothetical protein